MTHRIKIIDADESANGDVYLDTWVQKEISPEVWETIDNGNRKIIMDGQAILAITNGAGTDAEKRNALLELFRQEVISWGIVVSDDAKIALEALLPTGWPVTIAI